MRKIILSISVLLILGLVCANISCKKSETDKKTDISSVKSAPENTAQPPATQPATGHPQTTCPIMGGQIDKKFFVDYQGKRIYFCCGGCPDQFKADPEKYITKMEKDGVTFEKAPPTTK